MVQTVEDQSRIINLESSWDSVVKSRHEMAAELSRLSKELPGEYRKKLELIGAWFQGPTEFEDALLRPNVLAFCIPLASDRSDSPTRISDAARVGVGTLSSSHTEFHSLLRMLFYPIVIFVAASLVGIGFSFFVAPQFEQMYDEFGIELPFITNGVLGLSKLVRNFAWVAIVIPLGIVAYWLIDSVHLKQRSRNDSWLDYRWTSTRYGIGSWSWHLSMLLEAGLTQAAAIRKACLASSNSRIRKVSPSPDGMDVSVAESNVANVDSLGRRYELLSYALELPVSNGKIALLREIATNYWDRRRNISDWWVYWLVAILPWAILAVVGIAILSLFTPMIAVISGLTGGKF